MGAGEQRHAGDADERTDGQDEARVTSGECRRDERCAQAGDEQPDRESAGDDGLGPTRVVGDVGRNDGEAVEQHAHEMSCVAARVSVARRSDDDPHPASRSGSAPPSRTIGT